LILEQVFGSIKVRKVTFFEKHTHKNAFITNETESVAESGDCGGFAKGGNLP